MTKHILFRVGEFDFKNDILTRLSLEALETCAEQINKAKGSETFLKVRYGNKIVGKVLKGTAEVIETILVADIQWTVEKYIGVTPKMQRIISGFSAKK